MRIALLHLFILVSWCGFGQTVKAPGTVPGTAPGNVPYVTYSGDTTCIRSVASGTNCKILKAGATTTVQVKFDNHPEWDFNVTLKKKLSPEPCQFPAVTNLLVLSDIEGEFEAFRNLLITNKVVDKNYNWIFGKGHLVICGDLFDRGNEVTEYLWLLYKLEQDAPKKGGYVHVILGNHDIMNMSEDFRYVQPKYIEEAKALNLEYKDLFTANTELGRWLRTKNIIEKIGKNLYLHAGISQKVNSFQWDLPTINNFVRPYYDQGMYRLPDSVNVFFDDEGPFWYRGYFKAPLATQTQLDSTLSLFGVKKIIVGHTIIEHVSTYYNNVVYGIDVNQHEGSHEGLLINDGKYFRVDDHGNKTPL